MNIFPAIDLYDNKVVRLYKGRYEDMTVYSDDPISVVRHFEEAGAEYLHIVDLMGAKEGKLCAFDTVKKIASSTDLKIEVGGGIRTEDAIKRYIDAGAEKVILGTAAALDEELLSMSAYQYGKHIAVGVDLKDGYVAVKGWTETSDISCDDMFTSLATHGITRVICTDISRDGAMMGTNIDLYKSLSESYKINVVASGGVSTLDDIRALKDIGLFGAIIGKAYYTGAIDLNEAIRIGK